MGGAGIGKPCMGMGNPGAGIGIGYEVARRFALAGAPVALNDLDAAAATAGVGAQMGFKSIQNLTSVPSVGPVGFEPTTNGLKDSRTTKAYQGDNAAVVRSWCADGGESARAVVALAASGQMVPGVLLQGLAKAVLKSAAVRLAEQILQGGPFALDRALELAELVLQGEEAGGAVSTVDTAKPRAELARKRTA